MTKKEFIKAIDKHKKALHSAFGSYLTMLAKDVMNISKIEEDIEAIPGYTTERFANHGMPYSKIFFNKKDIGTIDLQGFPTIMLRKRNKKHAIVLMELPGVIEPIDGIHRVLAWHTVEGKMHKLAGGEIVLNFMPREFTVKQIEKFLKDTKLYPCIEDFKKREKEAFSEENLKKFVK